MAVYLASFNDTAIDRPAQDALAAKLEAATGHGHRRRPASARGSIRAPARCAIEVGGAPLFGSRPSLALNSNLHSATAGQSDPGDPARHRGSRYRATSAICRPSGTA